MLATVPLAPVARGELHGRNSRRRTPPENAGARERGLAQVGG